MSKKLLIAVLAFGFFALSGAVIGYDDGSLPSRDDTRAGKTHEEITFEGDRLVGTVDIQPEISQILPNHPAVTPSKHFPPDYYCDFIDPTESSYGEFWPVPWDSDEDGTWATQYFINRDYFYNEGYTCTLLTVYVGIDPELIDEGTGLPYMTGNPDMTVTIARGGSLGAPDIVGSVTVPYASLPTTQGYAAVDVSTIDGGNPLVLNHEDRMSVWISNPDGTGASQLIITSTAYGDPNSAGREFIFSYWTTFFWFGPESYALNIAYDVCCGDVPFSECFTSELNCSLTYGYTLPDWGGYARNQQCQLIQHTGRDTLKSVELFVGWVQGAAELKAFVYPDDGLGEPDTTAPLWQTVVSNADLVAAIDDYVLIDGMDVVMEPTENYWVGFTPNWDTWVDGDTVTIVTDDAEPECAYVGRYYTLCGYIDANCYFFVSSRNIAMKVTICKDEFDLCQFLGRIDEDCNPYWITPLAWYVDPYASSIDGIYKEISNLGLDCRIEAIRVGLVPRLGTAEYDADVYVYEQDGPGGLPGTMLGHKVIPAADIIDYDATGIYTVVDFSDLNIRTNSPLWIGVESQAPITSYNDDLWDIAVQRDDDVCGNIDGSITLWSDGWYGSSNATFMDAWVCCIKPPERDCGAPEDWPMGAHDLLRTAASNNNTGDAKNLQDVLWKDYQGSPTTPGLFMGVYGAPIIYDTIVCVPFGDRLVAYGINGDGAGGPNRMWEAYGPPYIGLSGFHNRPFAKDGKVYFGGSSQRSFQCFDIYTGDVIWSRNITNANQFNGNTDYSSPLILDVEGTEVIYFTTHIGELHALDASDGSTYTGWTTNPVLLDGDPKSTLSSNGVDILYVGTDGTSGDLYGTLYAIDAADGSTIWTLEEEGLLGHEIDEDTLGTLTTEIFQGPIGVDPLDGALYAIVGFNIELYGRPSGAFYKINPDGSVNWGVEGRFPRYTGPIIDAALVYYTSLTVAYDEFEGLWGIDKFTGEHVWEQDTMLFQTINWVEGGVDCRPLAPDMIYQPNMDFRFTVINSETGAVEFEYTYFDTLSDRGAGTAIGPEHVVMCNRGGDVFCFANGAEPRPRARFLKYEQFEVVEPTTYTVTHEAVLMNNGGANLTGSITVDELKPDTVLEEQPLAVDPVRLTRLTAMADQMVDYDYNSMTRTVSKPYNMNHHIMETGISGYETAQSSASKAAYGPPTWLTSLVTTTFDVAPGQSLDLVYDVDPTLVTRGPHNLYCTFTFDNEDYFLNKPGRDPVINYGVLGGCLEVDDIVYFGDGGANSGPVFNHTMYKDQAGSATWDIDGEDGAYYQGAIWFGAAKYRIATNCDSWHAEDNSDFWNTCLPDANLYGTCPPEQEDMVLGRIWNEATSSYDDVFGHVFHYAYIDSIVDYNCDLQGWDWGDVHCGYDNDLTIGLKVYEWMYGAEHEALGNFVIRKLRITNRNNTTLTGIGVGTFNDYDLESNRGDIFYYNEEYAIAYGQSCGIPTATWTWGQGSIPYTEAAPKHRLYNVHSLDAQQAMFDDDYIACDSIYYWMRNFVGQTYQPGLDMNIPCDPNSASDDREVWMGFDFRDYEPYGEATVGMYFFGYNNKNIVTDSAFFRELAVLVNQWAGFGRGDINRDNVIDLSDLVALFNLLYSGGEGPLFEHLADVDGSGAVDGGDMVYFTDYWFGMGPAPVGDWVLPETPLP